MELPDLSILLLHFRLQAEASVILPPFLGSTLRGAFGNALKQVFCFVPHENTENCWFREACPYQYIFESKNPGTLSRAELHPQLRGQKEFPPPFVLVAPDPIKKHGANLSENSHRDKNFNEDYQPNQFSTGETLDFSLLLIGTATHYWAQVLAAVRLFAANGLGEEYACVPFTLTEAFAHDSYGASLKVFSRENPRVSRGNVAPVKLAQIVGLRVAILKDELQKRADSCLQIKFVSPISQRILLDGNGGGQFDFYGFLKKLTERLEHLANLHAEPVQRIDYRSLLTGAKAVRTVNQSLQFYRYEQHSKRQERKIPRDVFLGKVLYTGEKINEFLPFLAAGELLNVGSNTTAGLGKFVIKA